MFFSQELYNYRFLELLIFPGQIIFPRALKFLWNKLSFPEGTIFLWTEYNFRLEHLDFPAATPRKNTYFLEHLHWPLSQLCLRFRTVRVIISWSSVRWCTSRCSKNSYATSHIFLLWGFTHTPFTGIYLCSVYRDSLWQWVAKSSWMRTAKNVTKQTFVIYLPSVQHTESSVLSWTLIYYQKKGEK